MGTQPLPKKGAERPPQFSAYVYCVQTAGCVKMALGMEVGLGPGHIVLDGDPASVPKKVAEPPPIFGPFLLWPNGLMHQDATWYAGRPQPRRLCVRWGPSYPATPRKSHHPTQFLAHVYCGQADGWIKMPLGTEVNLGPGDVVSDGVAVPPPKRGIAPSFRFMSVVAKRLYG